MGRISSWLWGAAIGAGMMYFMDPQNGSRRKAMVRDKAYHLRHQADDGISTAVNDLRNRAHGLLSEGVSLISPDQAADEVVEDRIRSRIGFYARHPGAVQVFVHNGVAFLSGDALADEVDGLLRGVRHIRGVKDVENQVRVHADAGDITQLQGEGSLSGENRPAQWSPSTRMLVFLGGSYLMIYGMVRGGIIGFLARIGGVALGTRALTNRSFQQMTGAQEGAVSVHKSIQIQAPVDTVYDLWSHFENFPRFMNNIISITNTGSGLSHWVVKGPAGSLVEFDAVMTRDEPETLVAWETIPGSQVKHSGQVRFHSTEEGGTQVSVSMAYTPPAGIAGHAVAALFGKDPKSEMDADLRRMKALLEEGETTTGAHRVTREEVGSRAPVPVTGQHGGGQSGGSQSGERLSGDMSGVMGMDTDDDRPASRSDMDDSEEYPG